MRLKLDWRKGAQENAAGYYLLAKELAKKEEGARKAIAETEEELAKAVKEGERAAAEKKAPAMRRRKEWHEKFRWFYTSGERLVLAGRDAKQNDLLVGKIMKDEDLFFHADIQGAPATILADGKRASGQEKKEAAQFAASHSSAWKTGAAGVDVYAVGKSQLSKHASGGFVGQGGFAIKGEREWFRGTPLGLAVGAKEELLLCLPACHPGAVALEFSLSPGRDEKGKTARDIARATGTPADEALLALPSGGFLVSRRK